jgi:Centromere DNA-binding protein complex CBF3 subunit, domain 2
VSPGEFVCVFCFFCCQIHYLTCLCVVAFSQEGVRALGNWNPTTQESTYSSKLPMRKIRAMGGFMQNAGLHFNPRTAVDPPAELLAMVFPWVDDTLASVVAYEQTKQDVKGTATGFLKLLVQLKRVLLQDTACYLLKHGEMCENHLFFQHDVFRTTLFIEFVKQMEEELNGSEKESPMKATIESVLPGVQAQFTNLHRDLVEVRRVLDNIYDGPKDSGGITGTLFVG